VNSVAFSPDGRLLASGGDDGAVSLWDSATGEALRSLQGHTDWVRSVAFSPDGRLLASGGDDWAVRLWDSATGEALRSLKEHTRWVISVAFSPDGRLLASGGSDGAVRLWAPGKPGALGILLGFSKGWAAVTPEGPYKFAGMAIGEFWYAIGLCRFDPGELDPYVPDLQRVDETQKLWNLPTLGSWEELTHPT
jgi:WD40 repeat protein